MKTMVKTFFYLVSILLFMLPIELIQFKLKERVN